MFKANRGAFGLGLEFGFEPSGLAQYGCGCVCACGWGVCMCICVFPHRWLRMFFHFININLALFSFFFFCYLGPYVLKLPPRCIELDYAIFIYFLMFLVMKSLVGALFSLVL